MSRREVFADDTLRLGIPISVEIESGGVTGTFPRRALAHVQEWRELHKSELLEDWRLADERKPMNKIAPLE